MAKELKWYSFRLRILFVVIISLMLLGSCIGCKLGGLTKLLPMGTGPAGPAVSNSDFEIAWTESKVVLTGFGDSITTGFGASSKHGYFALLRNNDDETYPEMAGMDLSHVIENLTAVNYSQNYTVSQEHIDWQILPQSVWPGDVHGVVVLTTGGNDLIHDYGKSPPKDGAMYGCTYEQGVEWVENLQMRIRTELDEIIDMFPGGCDIFLGNLYDPTDGVSDPQRVGLPRWPDAVKIVTLTNEKIRELTEEYENVHLVDFHTEFLGHGIHCNQSRNKYYHKDDPTFWYFQNLEDPNRRGYDAIRRLFLIKMAEVLPERLN